MTDIESPPPISEDLEGGPFTVTFDPSPQKSLDEHALQARQDHNFGNTDRWFQAFRGGHYGMYARLNGVTERYAELHAWRYQPRHPAGVDTPMGELFFNADSALECLVFGLNALGRGVGGTGFRDTMSESELRRSAPRTRLMGRSPAGQKYFRDSAVPLIKDGMNGSSRCWTSMTSRNTDTRRTKGAAYGVTRQLGSGRGSGSPRRRTPADSTSCRMRRSS